jgi:guanine deaminase
MHDHFMREALRLAADNARSGEGGPFGAVVVLDNEIIGTGVNRVTTTHDPTAHAEVTAIRDACRRLGRFDLRGATLYSSCEPCPMCLAAILWARLDQLFYAATREDAARAGFDDAYFYEQVALPPHQRDLPSAALLPEEAATPFTAWLESPHRTPY